MNTTQPESTALQTVSAPAEPQHVSANSLMMNPEAMDRVMRMAEMMASGKSTIPAHLQKNPADCMAVVLQAMQWGMLPHVVAQKTHIVNGTLGYEAQLVNAVVQQSGTITGRFHYEYHGNSPAMECRVGAVIRGESEITWGEWLNESKVTTKNSPLWKTNPKQQLGYLQVKNWARLYCPGAILGVYSPEEIDQAEPPRDMGPVHVIPTSEQGASDDLVTAARAAAAQGKAVFAKFFNGLAKDIRPQLRHIRAELDKTAADFDAARTVETPPLQTPAPQPARKTLDEVMGMLMAAKNLDALYVAGDWVGDLKDPAEQKIAADKFDEIKFKMEME